MNKIQVFNLKRLDFSKALNVQKYFVNKLLLPQNDELDTLLLVEHNPVYTIGIRRSKYKSEELEKLKSLSASVELTDRGGLITFHGHGQLVAYPIINLKRHKPSLKWYVSQLESTIIQLCADVYNLKASRLCNIGYTGVWVNDAKIAAIGIHCKRYITYHGIALNCNIDLNWFSHIVPCGIEDKKVTSLTKLLNKTITIDQVTPHFLDTFKNLFNSQLIMKSDQDTEELLKAADTNTNK